MSTRLALMNDLQEYIKLPKSHQLYSTGLSLLRKYGQEHYPAELQKLSVGPMGNNRLQLMQLLKKICSQPISAKPSVIRVHAAPVQTSDITPTNGKEIELLLQLRKARQNRAKCSQQLHGCHSDTERAQVCDMIDRASAEVKSLEQQYNHLKATGSLPPEEEDDFNIPLPNTLDDLKKEQTRLSSLRLKTEKRLIYLYNLPDNSRKRNQIPGYEKKLRSINARWSAVRLKCKQIEYESEENDT
jgi:uncharacterized protein YhaN